MKRYGQHVKSLGSCYAMTTDAAMITMQCSLKRRDMISARLGDLLSMLYLISMVLKHYEDDGCPADDLPLAEWSCQYLLNCYQQAMHELLQNFPSQLVAVKMRLLIFPVGQWFNKPSDKLETRIANLVTTDTETRRRLVAGIYITAADNNPLGRLNDVFMETAEVAPLEKKLRDAVKAGKLERLLGVELIDAAEQAELLSKEEAKQLGEYHARVMDIINVDEFPYDEFAREALPGKTQTRKRKTRARKKTGKATAKD